MQEEMTSAAVPGTGQVPAGKPSNFGDPIVNPSSAAKWKKANASGAGGILRRRKGSFAGAAVFEVSNAVFHNLTMQKRKGKHWRTYLDEDDSFAEIAEHARKNKGPIVVQNEVTGEMRYVRYKG